MGVTPSWLFPLESGIHRLAGRPDGEIGPPGVLPGKAGNLGWRFPQIGRDLRRGGWAWGRFAGYVRHERLSAGVHHIGAGVASFSGGALGRGAGAGEPSAGADELGAGIGELGAGIGELGAGIGELGAGIGELGAGIRRPERGVSGDLSEGRGERGVRVFGVGRESLWTPRS